MLKVDIYISSLEPVPLKHLWKLGDVYRRKDKHFKHLAKIL